MKTSRDLMLLAAVAFKNGKFDDAGALFASSLSSEDSDSFLNEVNRIGNPDAENLNIESVSSDTSNLSLSQIAQSLSGAIKDSVESGDDDEDQEDEDEEDLEDEEDTDEEDEEDAEDDESVSTSSGSGIQRRTKGRPQLVISVANSPIKLKS